MSLKKENNQKSADKQKPIVTPWQAPDPWPARSEEFYGMVYRGGRCRYCGKAIHTHLDMCSCASMIAARERFKRLVRSGSIVAPSPAAPVTPPEPIDNPDRNHSPEIPEIDDVPF